MSLNLKTISCRLLAVLLVAPVALMACGEDTGGGEVGSTNADSGGGGSVDDTKIGDQDAGSTATDTGASTADTGAGAEDSGSAGEDAGAGAADTGAEDSGASSNDAGSSSADTGEVTCPGGPNCACKDNQDCDSGICLDTADGKKCATTCVDTCPQGFACKNIGSGADTLQVCVSEKVSLCAPCKEHKDCVVNGVDSLCLDYGAAGKFCGAPCKADSDCPTDYTCADTKDAAGKSVKQCKTKVVASGGSGKACSKEGDCDAKAGETCVDSKCQIAEHKACGCSVWATAQGAETNCAVSNEFGSCTATRKCTATGLGKCTAQTPKSEVCNGVDDDCNGTKDDLPKDYKCSKKAFDTKGSKSDCKTDADCTTEGEACDTKAGKCMILVGECFGKPTCSSSGELICNEAATPTLEQCNLKDDDCDGKTDEGYSWKDPVSGKELAVNESCGDGPCAGGKVLCDSFTKATCDSFSKAKPEKGACDGIDNDCNGKTDDMACDDGDLCTKDSCNSKDKKCSNEANITCDDKNPCTKDSCDAKTGKCVNEPTVGASCDDKNACTDGDVCGKHPKTGALSCLPGKPKSCDDKNACTDDKCDTSKGCLNLPNAATEVCYSGAKGTAGVGTCTSGIRTCKDGKFTAACVGEVVPAKAESCDGKDDTCNGKTDEGCKPTNIAVTFSSAYVAGKSGSGSKAVDVQMIVGASGPVGQAKGQKHQVDFGFLAWLMALLK